MLSSAEINPQSLVKNIKTFKESKESYEKAHAEFLKGRDIKKAETDAKLKVEKAELEAKRILDNAKDFEKRARDAELEALEFKAKAKDLAAKMKKDSDECKAIKKLLAASMLSLTTKVDDAKLATTCANNAKADYDKKLAEINRVLTNLANG